MQPEQLDKLLEIADTAVKIGLSALIGGVFGYLLTKSQHRHELVRELTRRRCDSL